MPLAGEPVKQQTTKTFTSFPSFFERRKTAKRFRRSILEDKSIKVLTLGSPRLDDKIKFESGINLLYGPSGTGKTNTCLRLAFQALDRGWKVIYYDLEDGVHPVRLLQMYKSNSWNFKIDKLYTSFVKPENLDWKEVTDDFKRIISLEKPDLFVIDALTPLFIKEFRCASVRNRWNVSGKLENLTFDLWEHCHNSKSITVVVSHAGKKSEKKSEDFKRQISNLTSEPELFKGVGSRLAFLSKMWLYVIKVVDENDVLHRYYVITKRKVGKDFYSSRELIEFSITDKGVE